MSGLPTVYRSGGESGFIVVGVTAARAAHGDLRKGLRAASDALVIRRNRSFEITFPAQRKVAPTPEEYRARIRKRVSRKAWQFREVFERGLIGRG